MKNLSLFVIMINFKVNGNHEITTQKWKRKFYSPPGFKPWSPRTNSQCANNELRWPFSSKLSTHKIEEIFLYYQALANLKHKFSGDLTIELFGFQIVNSSWVVKWVDFECDLSSKQFRLIISYTTLALKDQRVSIHIRCGMYQKERERSLIICYCMISRDSYNTMYNSGYGAGCKT